MPIAQPQPAGPQAQPGQPQGGQGPPFGSPGAPSPTPNRGAEAGAMQKLGMAVKMIGEALGQAGATSELGQKILEVLPKLSKMVVPGSSTPASEKNTLDQTAMKQAQQNQQMQMMRQQQMKAAQGGGGQPGAPQMPGQAAA